MIFKRSSFLCSAYDELLLVGSRWRRIFAKSPLQGVAPSRGQAPSVTPYITIIPTLHVASIKFYDCVLEYLRCAVQRNKNTVILLEGICDSNEARQAQLQEYNDITQNEALREAMVSKADNDSLYTETTRREICSELAIDYDALFRHIETVRLQECYLKPKMAAYCGLHLRNHADLDMTEVQTLLQNEAAQRDTLGELLPNSVSVREIGLFPVIRKNRERKVAHIARVQCERWFEEAIEGEVIVPWGYFHTEAILHYITAPNSHNHGHGENNQDTLSTTEVRAQDASPDCGRDATKDASTTPPPRSVKPTLVFVEADELFCKVTFGAPKEVIEPNPGTTQKVNILESTPTSSTT